MFLALVQVVVGGAANVWTVADPEGWGNGAIKQLYGRATIPLQTSASNNALG